MDGWYITSACLVHVQYYMVRCHRYMVRGTLMVRISLVHVQYKVRGTWYSSQILNGACVRGAGTGYLPHA